MIKELLFFFCGLAFGLLLIKLSTLIKDHKKKNYKQINKHSFITNHFMLKSRLENISF